MKLKIYIAGPMSGKEDFNRAAFNAAAPHVGEGALDRWLAERR